jgi:uracil-DNA glycosylase
MNKKITQYQKDCFDHYKASISYPAHYTYLHGNPINPLVPVETPLNKVMIVGAYPTAKFYREDKYNDTPLADIDAPFANQTYFDGSRVRKVLSGDELNEVILKNIGVDRKDCWITNLVKVFLFKEGHAKRYNMLGKKDLKENRSQFKEYAKSSIEWLNKEIAICQPQVIILLGVEVTQAIFKESAAKATARLSGDVFTKKNQNYICLPHPGILMRGHTEWPVKFEKKIAPKAKLNIEKLAL